MQSHRDAAIGEDRAGSTIVTIATDQAVCPRGIVPAREGDNRATMAASGVTLSALTDKNLRAAYGYWDAKRAGRSMPSRSDIDPQEIPRLLPSIILIDVLPPDDRLRVRLAGTMVVETYGEDYTGRYLDQIYFGEQRDNVLRDYRAAVASRLPHYGQHRFHNVNDITYEIERIILPLSNDDSSVNMLMAVLSFREAVPTFTSE